MRRLQLEHGEELDAAVSLVFGQSPTVLPFTTDPRARPKLQEWLRRNGAVGDLGRPPNSDLCIGVICTWLRQHGGWQLFSARGTYRAVFADRITATSEDYVVALARLVLLVGEAGYGDAVRDLMADDYPAERDGEHDPFAAI